MPGTTPTSHRDVKKISVVVSEIQHDLVQILKDRGDNDSQSQSKVVSNLSALQ
jgi:hypothetical protein